MHHQRPKLHVINGIGLKPAVQGFYWPRISLVFKMGLIV